MANINQWFTSFLNRQPTADESKQYSDLANKSGDNAALNQFLQMAGQERPMSSLTDYQQKAWNEAVSVLNKPVATDLPAQLNLTDNMGSGYSAWALADPEFQGMANDVTNGNARQVDLDNLAKKIDAVHAAGGDSASAQRLTDAANQQALDGLTNANVNPNGHQSGWDKADIYGPLMVAALVAAPLAMTAGAGASGSAATAGVAGTGATTGTAAGVGGATAAAGAGGAAAGATTGLSGLWASLPASLQTALTSAGIKAGTNLVTGQPLTSGVLKAGLMSGLGSFAGSALNGVVGDGLKNLGISADTAQSLVKPITTGVISTGTSLAKGQSLGQSLLGGIGSGTISYAGNSLNDYLKDQGLSKTSTDILTSTGKGALSSAVKGNNPLTGALGGAVQGGVNYATGAISDNLKSNDTKATMGGTSTNDDDDTDYGSFNGQNYLDSLGTNYSDPLGLQSGGSWYNTPSSVDNTSLTDLLSNDQFKDLYGQYLDPTTASDSATGNSSFLSDLLGKGTSSLGTALGNSAASALTGKTSSSSSFLDSLTKQLSGLGSTASSNPLAAISALIAGAGTLKNAISGAPNNLSAVTDLMNKGSTQMNSAATNIPAFNNLVARNPYASVQHFNSDNNPVAATSAQLGTSPTSNLDYNSILKNLYQTGLGRAPDAAGNDYWSQQLQNGTSQDAILKMMQQSPEAQSKLTSGGLGSVGV